MSKGPKTRRARLQGVLIGSAVAALLAGGVASASVFEPTAQPATIHGCVNTSNRQLTVPKAGSKCPNGTTAISWNTTGPRGLPGQPPQPDLARVATLNWWGGTYGGDSYRFDSPDGIAFDGTHIWVANGGGNSVTELDASSGAGPDPLGWLLRVQRPRRHRL